MNKIDKLIFTLERLRDEKSNEIGLAAIKAIDEGIPELKKLLGERLEQEQKQEKEDQDKEKNKGRAETGEMRAFLDMAREANIRK